MTRQPISAVFADRARTAPEDVIVVDRTGPATAAEIDTRATRVARLLLDRGVRRDDRVIVSLPNEIGFVVACVAIWRVGATPMPMSPELPDDERAQIEDIARPTAAFGRRPARAEIAWVDEDHAGALSDDRLPDTWAHSWKAPTSSGSTGRPKVIASTAPALVDPDAAVASFVPQHAIQLVSSPLWHSTAFTYAFRGLTAGHRIVLEPSFDERAFLAAVERHRVTWAVLSPPSVRRLLRLPESARAERDLSSLQSILHLGGRCPAPDKYALLDWLGPGRVVEVYAGSESNGLTMVTGGDWLSRPGTVGRPVGGTEISIRHTDATPAQTGDIGTIWMRRGMSSAYTYLGAPSRRTDDGWDTLGDIGYLDDDGYLFVIDRAADVIRCGDATVYPADVEQAFEEHPMVRGAVAVGEPGPHGVHGLTVVVDVADAEVTAAALHAFARRRLPEVARPQRICLTHRPIRNDAGKIRRRALAGCSRYGTEHTLLRANGASA
ncbi:AMP-binding protein [Gordonia insulae]|uniref:Bile acid-coenzyme A ligase n=1 Tax=Gordonia insulae TaxID=2420509 RepID=A0A3G8JSE2_9ACTN|nr:AMP-binding protein [Gordonia insulae]AZG47100.1 Bile acid-coenzyme A ligase [Gordonia insulae]